MFSLFGVTTNGLIAVAYVVIASIVFRGLWKTKQLTSNPLALATGAIFFTCGIGHGMHAYVAATSDHAMPFETWIWAWDAVTATIAILYLTLRNRFPALLRGTAMYEDLLQRQREAVQINDNIVQGLAEAKLALEMGEETQGREALERSLVAAKGIISNLMGDQNRGNALGPGDLRRKTSASPEKGAVP